MSNKTYRPFMICLGTWDFESFSIKELLAGHCNSRITVLGFKICLAR
jgi:hypothetical protein